MTPSDAFVGRTALVTGAGRGIGRAIALALAEAGANVALVSRTQQELEDTAGAVHAHGRRTLICRCDVGDRGALQGMVEVVRTDLGPIDILVNNAAVVWPLASTTDVDPEEYAAAFAINVFGPVNLAIALLPHMLDQRWGRIVNVSSGVVARPAGMIRGNAYLASKAALEAHTLNLAAELAGSGVTVNSYRPGTVDTAMQAWIRAQSPEVVGAELHERFMSRYEAGALLTPETSAASLLKHLDSDATGEIWSVDAP